MANAVVGPGPAAGPLTTVAGVTPEMQRQYQLLKESGLHDGMLAGVFAGSPAYNEADFNKAFQGAKYTPQDIFTLTGGENQGVTQGEWDRLSPEIQQSILNDPGTFLRGQFGKTHDDMLSQHNNEMTNAGFMYADGTPIIGSTLDLFGGSYMDGGNSVALNPEDGRYYTMRNGERVEAVKNPNYLSKTYGKDQLANDPLSKAGLNPDQWKTYTGNDGGSGDLLSVGAEGGIKDYKNLKWIPGVGLIHPRNDYIHVTDQDENVIPSIIMGLATGGMGALAAPAMGAMGSAALTGAMSAANADVSGGDPWKAFFGNFLGAAAAPYINSALPADLPKWASSAIKGGAGSLIGGAATGNVDIANILGAAAGAGIGSSVADYSGSPELGKLSGALTRYFANSGRKQPVSGAPRQPGARKITDQSGLPDSVRARLAELKGAV